MGRPPHGRLLFALLVALALTASHAPSTRAESPSVVVDWPTDGAAVGASVVVTGWAVAPEVEGGTGVDAVRAYLDGPAGTGRLVGRAAYGLTRPDVALALRDGRFGPSGWRIEADLPPGSRALFVYAHRADQPEEAGWIGPVQVSMRVDGGGFSGGVAGERIAATPVLSAPASGAACVGREASGVSCATSVAPTNNCAMPDRDSGRCLVRGGTANSRGPTAVVPGSWTAFDPASGMSAGPGAASGSGALGRIGYPLAPMAANAASGDRAPADPPGAAAPAPANNSNTSGATSAATSTATSGATSAATSGASAGRLATGSLSLSVASMGGRQAQLNWNAFTAGSPVTYEVRRCASMTSAAATCGLVATVQGGGYRLTQADGVYFIRALGPQGQSEGESNRVNLGRGWGS